MTDHLTEITPEFQRGWNAALIAARSWHEFAGKEDLDLGETQQVSKEFGAGSRGPSEISRNDRRAESGRRLIAGPSARSLSLPGLWLHQLDPISGGIFDIKSAVALEGLIFDNAIASLLQFRYKRSKIIHDEGRVRVNECVLSGAGIGLLATASRRYAI